MGNDCFCCSKSSVYDQTVTSPCAKLYPKQQKKNISQEEVTQNIYKWSSNKEYKQFITKIQQLRSKIHQKINPSKSLLSKTKWQQLFDSFDKHYLTTYDRYQLTKTLTKLLKVELWRPFSEQQIKQEFLQTIDEVDISDEISYKLKSLKLRIKQRRKQALLYMEFIKEFSSYGIFYQDIQKVANRVSEFCKSDINAFSFITLYLLHCANQQLNKFPQKLFQSVNQMKSILNKLSIKFPPSSIENEDESEADQQSIFESPNNNQYSQIITFPLIKFTTNDFRQKLQEIQQFILLKARNAKRDKTTFQNILMPICLKRGNSFQSALKLKNQTLAQVLSILRAIQKFVLKDNQQLWERQLTTKKQQIIREVNNNKQYRKVNLLSMKQVQVFDNVQYKILKGKTEIPFTVTDMLRAKAMFKTKDDVYKTFKDIEFAFSKLTNNKYRILQIQDRLQKPTKDFKILFKIGETIAQLQLVKEMSKSANEFNHKIYELKRSKTFSPLFNLLFINEKLSQIFFGDLTEFLFQMIKYGQVDFISGRQQVEKFLKQYLAKNVKSFQDCETGKQAQNSIFVKDLGSMKNQINKNFQEMNSLLNLGYNENQSYQRQNIRKNNDKHFML